MVNYDDNVNTSKNASPVHGWELYLIVLYVVLDWFFRHVAFTFMAGPWDELLFIFIVGVWIIRAAIYRLRPEGSPMLVPIMLYVGVMVFLVLINSPNYAIAIEGLRVMIQFIFWFFLAYNLVFSREHFKGLIDFFLLICVIVSFYGILQYLLGVEMPAGWVDSAEATITTRVFSIIGSPNILGSLIVLSLPIAFALYFISNNLLKKALYAVAILILAGCLVFTFSRGAWLAFILAAFFLGIWVDRRIILGMVIVAFLTPTFMPTVYDRMAYMLSSDYIESSERGGRLGRWEVSLNHWRASPEVGVGLGQFGGAVAARNFPEESFYADNWYMKVGVETGMVGLGATLLLFVYGLRQARRAIDETEDEYMRYLGLGILVGLIGVLAHNVVENVFEVPMMSSYYWFLLGLVMALPRISERRIDTGSLRSRTDLTD
ncbi:O-antigen polymerase [Candidatus Syntrophocurvum alkaliphilum]|uniref:O-antigen polymerase n=1 Tax=Candidatus Syntrophocurvum alkaliphilum TaxID=2293317 RepID=A0A6I6DHB4_9FIRM|nr:O-antigen ligase family protein [Candidatus Syntrophocurvum alkaliphilum]QGU00483.1 O-antigen polymerase [Candidatus Syntrophocurvum alkaliphilum]